MAEGTGELTVAQRLGQLLDRGLLPAGGPAEAAERLIERLERPARIALLGLPGSGKSAILNLLAGTIVVPETLRLPTIIVQHGTEPRMICTLTDGRTKVLPGANLADVLTLAPALVTLEMDIPALKVISLLEVSAGPMEAEQRRAASWASKRADIIIWCTTSYLPKEQIVWESMPDVVKDNGFLFLTKVDLLGSREAAAGMLERVEQRAAEDFRDVLAISAKQARAAMPPGGPVDREMFRDSGAAAVISTIKSRVQAAHRADTDMAELLLARHVEASSIVAKRFAEEDQPDAAQKVEWVPPPDLETPVEADTGTPAEAEVEIAEVEPELSPPEPEAEPEPELSAELESSVQAVLDAITTSNPSEPPAYAEEVEGPASAPEPELEPIARTAAEFVEEARPEEAPEEVPEAAQDRLTPPATPVVAPADPAFTVMSASKRFTDRIRQFPGSDDVAPSPVPLKTTWKSRAETTAAPAKPEAPGFARMEPQPPAQSPAPPEPEAQAVSGDAVPRPAPASERPARETGRPRPGIPPKPTPGPQGFGGRRVLSEPPPDLSALRSALTAPTETTEDQEPAEEDLVDDTAAAEAVVEEAIVEEAVVDAVSEETATEETEVEAAPSEPEVEAPAPLVAPPQPVAPIPSPGPGQNILTRRPFVAMSRPAAPQATDSPMAMPSPRVAVLRDRRPEPAVAEAPVRRERPRVALRPIAAAPAAPASVPASERSILDRAIALIIARSIELQEMVDPEERPPVDMILDHVRDTIEQAIGILDGGSSGEVRRINADHQEALDVVMLMQLEKGHAPADDALTLILQLRRDLETLRTA